MILGAESRGRNTRKIDGSTCIRDTAPCRTDEPLGRLTFFHAEAVRRVAPLITNTVHLFLSFTPCTSLRRSPSHLPLVCPVRSCTFPSLALASSRTRSFSPLGRQSPLHWRSDRSSILSLRVYHSFPQQCRRRAEAILRDSTGVPYYLRKIFNWKIKLK